MKRIAIIFLAIFALTFSTFAEDLEIEIDHDAYEASISENIDIVKNDLSSTNSTPSHSVEIDSVDGEHLVEIDLPETEITKEGSVVKSSPKYSEEEFISTENHVVEIIEEKLEIKKEEITSPSEKTIIRNEESKEFQSIGSLLPKRNVFILEDDPRVKLLFE